METFNTFNELFLDVWNNGVFGLNATDIIISLYKKKGKLVCPFVL